MDLNDGDEVRTAMRRLEAVDRDARTPAPFPDLLARISAEQKNAAEQPGWGWQKSLRLVGHLMKSQFIVVGWTAVPVMLALLGIGAVLASMQTNTSTATSVFCALTVVSTIVTASVVSSSRLSSESLTVMPVSPSLVLAARTASFLGTNLAAAVLASLLLGAQGTGVSALELLTGWFGASTIAAGVITLLGVRFYPAVGIAVGMILGLILIPRPDAGVPGVGLGGVLETLHTVVPVGVPVAVGIVCLVAAVYAAGHGVTRGSGRSVAV